jgi:serine/threonine protein kinase
MIGNQILNYKIISLLGEGGMANVYLAQHQSLGNNVAIKFLKEKYVQNTNIRKRFIAEARNLVKMSHPNIIKVIDLIDAGDIVAFVMEYIEGQTLEDFLSKKGKLTSLEIEGLFNQMILAVEYVHEQGLIHRDIKPSNFMVTNNEQIKLLDFGIAKNTNEGAVDYTKTGLAQQMGTPLYMSPEQVRGTSEITKETDYYSLGIVLWQMVMNKKPYDSTEFSLPEIQVSILKEPLPLTNTIWDEIIQNATKKKHESRFINKKKLNDSNDTDDTILDSTLKKKIKIFMVFGALFFIILTTVIFKSSLFKNSSSVTEKEKKIDTTTTKPETPIAKSDTKIVKESRKVIVEKQEGENQKIIRTISNSDEEEFTKFEDVADVESKVKNILFDLLPESDSFRQKNKQRFDALLNFAFNNFSSILPTDKNSDQFIELCNSKNNLFFELKKSKIMFSKEKINNICL